MHKSTEWFQIQSGEHEGRWHLKGWMLSALPGDDGGVAFGNCPLCYAMVLADEGHAYGDLTWNHEQWHAQTDFPIPAERVEPESDPFANHPPLHVGHHGWVGGGGAGPGVHPSGATGSNGRP